ncbi:hypothetical protein SAMN04488121_11681, partial [Chitinophaga filiformis]
SAPLGASVFVARGDNPGGHNGGDNPVHNGVTTLGICEVTTRDLLVTTPGTDMRFVRINE